MMLKTSTDEACTDTGTFSAVGEAERAIIDFCYAVISPRIGSGFSTESAKNFQEKFRYEENFIS